MVSVQTMKDSSMQGEHCGWRDRFRKREVFFVKYERRLKKQLSPLTYKTTNRWQHSDR